MHKADIAILILSITLILLLIFTSRKQYRNDENDDGMELEEEPTKEGYRRGWSRLGWRGPGWGRRRKWLWW